MDRKCDSTIYEGCSDKQAWQAPELQVQPIKAAEDNESFNGSLHENKQNAA